MSDTTDKEDLVRKALSDRGIPKDVFDFIRYNLGDGAAVAAILVGEYKTPVFAAPERCCE